MTPSTKWDYRFMDLAEHIAQWSKDPRTRLGCVIVGSKKEIVSTGFNGIPRGLDDDAPNRSDHESGEKYHWYEHAERNALYNALLCNRSVEGCTLYVTRNPCPDCARGIIQSGIKEVVIKSTDPQWAKKWNSDFSLAMMQEAGVSVRFLPVE